MSSPPGGPGPPPRLPPPVRWQLVWHLDKPTAELALAPVWGLLVGAASLRLGSVWYMLLFHWVSNVALDLAILARVG